MREFLETYSELSYRGARRGKAEPSVSGPGLRLAPSSLSGAHAGGADRGRGFVDFMNSMPRDGADNMPRLTKTAASSRSTT